MAFGNVDWSRSKFWMVWVDGTPTTKQRHIDECVAHEEAERLARQPQNIGKCVYVLEALDYCFVDVQPVKRVIL